MHSESPSFLHPNSPIAHALWLSPFIKQPPSGTPHAAHRTPTRLRPSASRTTHTRHTPISITRTHRDRERNCDRAFRHRPRSPSHASSLAGAVPPCFHSPFSPALVLPLIRHPKPCQRLLQFSSASLPQGVTLSAPWPMECTAARGGPSKPFGFGAPMVTLVRIFRMRAWSQLVAPDLEESVWRPSGCDREGLRSSWAAMAEALQRRGGESELLRVLGAGERLLLLGVQLYELLVRSGLSQRWLSRFPSGLHQYCTYYIRVSPDL